MHTKSDQEEEGVTKTSKESVADRNDDDDRELVDEWTSETSA